VHNPAQSAVFSIPDQTSRADVRWRLYVLVFGLCLAVPALLVMAFVVAVDPYYVFGSPSWQGFNAVRPYYEDHVVLAKPYQVRRLRPQAVSLGSSRAEVGIDPRHPGWGASNVFNFAIPASNSYEVMLAFLHAQALGAPLKQAVVDLDFFAYNIHFPMGADIFEPRFVDSASRDFADYLAKTLPHRPKQHETPEIAGTRTKSGWNEALYLAVNPDVAAAVKRGEFTSGLDHYERVGRAEHRKGASIPANWNETAYLEAHPDVAYAVAHGQFISGYHHYLVAGRTEGRLGGFLPADWDEKKYLAENPGARISIAMGYYHSGFAYYVAVGSKWRLPGGEPPKTLMQWAQRRWPALVPFIVQLRDRFRMIFSVTALRDALLTPFHQSDPSSFNDLGMRIWRGQDAFVRKLGGTGKLYRGYLTADRWNLWLQPPHYQYCFTNPQSGMTTFDPFRFMIRRAYARNTDLRLFVTPLHASIRTLITDLGLGTRYDFWLKELVRINAEEATRAHRKPFPIWDFSDVNTITREEIPPAGDLTPMHWFWEVSHYRKATADLMLDRIFGHHEPGRTVPADFGVQLTPVSIEVHIAHTHTGLAAWAADHPELASQILAAARNPKALNREAEATCW
jgi:hypothetical protein